MRRIAIACLTILLLGALAVPAASAHESYPIEDKILIILGEQNEPVYTYDWTNLDFIVRDNATGAPISGVEETVEATLIAPGGEELSMDIEPQHGSEGRYEFTQDYFLTQPGQYQVRLEGTINETDVTDTYLLPGPRQPMEAQAFPLSVDHDLRDLADENAALTDRVSELESQISDLEAQLASVEDKMANMDSGQSDEASANAPGVGLIAVLATLGAIAVARSRQG